MCAAGCTHLVYLTLSSYISTNYHASFYADFSTVLIFCQHHILKNLCNDVNVLYVFFLIYYKNFVTEWELYTVFRCKFRASLVWFGLFVHPFSHICNTGHINYRLQFTYYNTTYNIWPSTHIIQGDSLVRGPKQIWEKYSRVWRNAFKCVWMWKETSFSIDYKQVLFCIVPGMCTWIFKSLSQ